MDYIDGFVAAVPKANRERYEAYSREAAKIFREHGAIRVVECWGDDVKDGTVTSFPMAVKKAEDETVVFSWIAWPDREARNTGWEAVMQDERMSGQSPDAMPFDGRRMIYGGFQTIVDET